MKREDLLELHYITPIDNVLSILRSGILSHRLAAQVAHKSVAMAEIQDRRKKVVVPNGMPLHEYANLYIAAGIRCFHHFRREDTQLPPAVDGLSNQPGSGATTARVLDMSSCFSRLAAKSGSILPGIIHVKGEKRSLQGHLQDHYFSRLQLG
jgi:hypothetical protein